MTKHHQQTERKSYSIFGAGASGLYTAWRLLDGDPPALKDPKKQRAAMAMFRKKHLKEGDVLRLYDWGKYDFSKKNPGTREPGARVCTWHYQDRPTNSYLELGGMRYSFWDGSSKSEGHRLVTITIARLDLDQYAVPFNESADPLMSLRTRNMYISEVDSKNPAPYAANNYGADVPPDDGFTKIESVAITEDKGPTTRRQWCEFYQKGKITTTMPESSVFKKGDLLRDIGYWNLGYDMLGQEGFSYLSDGNGYSSNVVNSNSAQSFQVNNEFTPGTEYKTLTLGFSSMFDKLFAAIEQLARDRKVKFEYYPDTRLRSIVHQKTAVHYTTAKRAKPDALQAAKTCHAAFLAMPRSAIELVAQATRYNDTDGLDVLNHEKVQLYLESVLMEPSYKVGMFFDTAWWLEGTARYPARLSSYFLTPQGINQLRKQGFPETYLDEFAANGEPAIVNTSYSGKAAFVSACEQRIKKRLTIEEQNDLSAAAELDTIGPSITDMPIRQVVYFGDNALQENNKKVYGLLASYDDIFYTTFWKPLELGPKAERTVPESRDLQPLEGPRKATPAMIKMLRQQLAALHFGPQSQYSDVPKPLETRYMDWSLPPFSAGYHAYKSHYDIGDVQRKIRKPSQLIKGQDADIFIVGETYSNDQAWVEGAFCTAESVLNDFFGINPITDEKHYPFICPE